MYVFYWQKKIKVRKKFKKKIIAHAEQMMIKKIFSYIINYIIQEWNENYIIIIIELYQAEKSKQEKWEIYIIKINTQNCTFIRLY